MMKKLTLTLLTCLIFLSPNMVMSETMKDLVERDGLYYKKFSDVSFTGKLTGKKYRGTFKNGKKQGLWERYFDNGQLLDKGNYKEGRWYGPWVSYWSNGQLLLKRTYENGFSNGPAVSYYKNGQLRYKGTFKNGKEEGSWVSYKEDGTVDKINTGTFKHWLRVALPN